MLAVLIRGAFIVTAEPALDFLAESVVLLSAGRVNTGCTTPGCVSAISLTFSDVSTSSILAARVCSRIVVGPWNCKKS